MGCMAISCILLGTRRLASEDRDSLSTCSNMEADECCSFPELGGGGPGAKGEAKAQISKAILKKQQVIGPHATWCQNLVPCFA